MSFCMRFPVRSGTFTTHGVFQTAHVGTKAKSPAPAQAYCNWIFLVTDCCSLIAVLWVFPQET